MLKALNDLFDRAFSTKGADPVDREHALRIATALLLIEVARARITRMTSRKAPPWWPK